MNKIFYVCLENWYCDLSIKICLLQANIHAISEFIAKNLRKNLRISYIIDQWKVLRVLLRIGQSMHGGSLKTTLNSLFKIDLISAWIWIHALISRSVVLLTCAHRLIQYVRKSPIRAYETVRQASHVATW